MDINKLQGNELFAYLRTNKKDLLQTKQAGIKYSDSITVTPIVAKREVKTEATKVEGEDTTEVEKDTLDVTIVCNTAWYCDSHMDVLTDKAYAESINARGTSIPHIADHKQSSTSHVGDVTKVYTKVMPLTELGLAQKGTTTALLMDSTVRKDYNEDVFKFYANGKINQHSVGLSYGDIALAMNSDDKYDVEEKAVWDEYYPSVINKELVDKRGYFYIVPKVDIRENSCVLFGANSLTPTLSVKSDSSLGNVVHETVIQPTIGNTMTLEEAQGKIISLTEELATAKSAITVARLEATVAEKNRGLNILKAQETFGKDEGLRKAALSFIEKGIDVEVAIISFESIKEASQNATNVDTSDNAHKEGMDKSDAAQGKPKSAKDTLLAIAKAGSETNTEARFF